VQSVAAFALMVGGLVWMMLRHELFGTSAITIAIQVLAAALMLAARLAFGRRSFHAAANPTEGGLVTTGPYRWLRHPIYAAILYFIWAAALDHRSWQAIAAAVFVTIGALIRIQAEERLLIGMYPEYADYSARTARVIPFVL
jgi:protein-S-isoprenylcysteine O-methyltransferase Ste14